MDFAFELFASFFKRQTVEKEWFRDCILNPKYGIPVLIYRRTGKEWIILADGSASMDNIFLQIFKDEDEKHDQDIEDVNTETVRGGKEKTHRQSVAATGGSPSTADLTSVDSKIAAIIGEVSVCGIVSEKEGDTDVTETTEEQVLPESEAVDEQEVQGEGFSDADAQRPAQSSAPSAFGTCKSGRVLTDAVLQLQRETINAVNRVADEGAVARGRNAGV
ncbi:unnamed protein product [Leuciscus chuanchicus]